MATENFTTYTEVDPNSRITVTASRVTGAALARNEDAYVYKDKGVNYFDADFTHLLTVCMTAVTSGGRVYLWGLTNAIDDMKGIDDAGGSYLGLFIYWGGTTYQLYLEDCDSGTFQQTNWQDVVLGTAYYLEIVRDESVGTFGTLYCYIYSDAARTTLLATLSLALLTSKKDFRYIFAINTWNSGTTQTTSGYSEDLDISLVTGSPSVTTQAVSAIAATTATGNGNVTSLGNPVATQHGHVWATFPNPTTADSKTENGVPTATGAYTSSLTGLITNTIYYVRTYITSLVGTFYGAEVSFTTLGDVPVVSTDLVEYIAATTALGNGSIDNNGGSPVTEHGVCWSVNANPTTADSKTTDGATDVIGDFFSLITGLTAGTLYHVRAYATNTTGTGYGADRTFTTLAAGTPIVTTDTTTNIQPTGATGNGTIVDIGATTVTEHGHCWSTSVNPTTADSKTTKGAGVAGAFTSIITGLTAGTAYYVRAYATNSYGTAYGNNEIINAAPAGELKGQIAVKNETVVYTSKTGLRYYIQGVRY